MSSIANSILLITFYCRFDTGFAFAHFILCPPIVARSIYRFFKRDSSISSPTLRQLSVNSQRYVDFHKHMIRWTNLSRGGAGDICGKVSHHQVQKEGFAIGRNPDWKFTDRVSPMKSQKSFAEVPWLLREVPSLSQVAWWQLKSPHMRMRELGWVVKKVCPCLTFA